MSNATKTHESISPIKSNKSFPQEKSLFLTSTTQGSSSEVKSRQYTNNPCEERKLNNSQMNFATIVVDDQYQETEVLYDIASETCSFDS